jgi:hypothetical protein
MNLRLLPQLPSLHQISAAALQPPASIEFVPVIDAFVPKPKIQGAQGPNRGLGTTIYFDSAGVSVSGPMPTISKIASPSFAPS